MERFYGTQQWGGFLKILCITPYKDTRNKTKLLVFSM